MRPVDTMKAAGVGLGLVAVIAILILTAPPGRGERITLMVTGGTVVTSDASASVIPDGAVAVNGREIVAVGRAADLAARYRAATTIDARGQIILPGLINTHTHAPMVLYRGLADDLALMDWLTKYIFPAEKATVSPEFVRVGTRLAALEMIASGTTTFVDMYYFEADIAQVVKEAGLRAILGQSVIMFPVADAATPADALKRAEAFIERWKDDPLVTPAVAPHSAYTLDEAALTASREVANRHQVPMLIHLAETKDEVGIIQKAHGRSPTSYLDSLGAWSGRSIAAHAVWLSPEDMTTLAARGVGVAHNPESNMKLASGVAAVPTWIEQGMRAGLGTDGAASNNDLDMFEAMRQAAFLQKVATGNPQAMPARLAFELATRRGAAAIGMADRIGSLEVGKQADIVTVTIDGARQTPMFDPISHLVYVARGDDVRTTIVAGRILMKAGRVQTLRDADVLRDARAMANQVRAAVGLAMPGNEATRGK